MEDYFFKYGMIIVAVVVIFMIVGFVRNATDSTLEPTERFQQFEGKAENLASGIMNLCTSCLARINFNEDCYLIETELKDTLTQDMFDESNLNIELMEPLPAGSYELKLINEDNTCKILRIG